MSQDTRRETKFDALHKKYEADIAIAKKLGMLILVVN